MHAHNKYIQPQITDKQYTHTRITDTISESDSGSGSESDSDNESDSDSDSDTDSSILSYQRWRSSWESRLPGTGAVLHI